MFQMCQEITVCEPGGQGRSRRLSSRPALVIAVSVGILMLCAGSGSVHAAAYVGLGVGNVAPTVDQGSVEFDTQDWSPNSTAVRLFGGYMLSERLGIEAGYIALGKARVTTAGGDFFEANTAGFEVTPVVLLHLGAGLSALARAGLIFWNSAASYHYTSLEDGTKSESGSSLTWSLGARYDLVGPLGVRAEYTRYAVDKTKGGAGNFNVILLSAVVGF
jgi:opacity protein-like surface antigen